MGQGALFSNLTAKKYAKQPIADQASYEKKLELTRKYLTPESEVLEIGCGTGSTAVLHAPYVKHIEGIDYASNMIAIANEKVKRQSIPNAIFNVEDVKNLAAKNRQYDAVLGMNIIHLLGQKDQKLALKNIHSLLKPNGFFISSTICSLPIPWYLKLIVKLGSGIQLLPPINVLSESDLKESLKSAGFSIVEQWSHSEKFKVTFLVAKKVE